MNGTVVEQGQAVQISVKATNSQLLSGVAVVGQGPLGISTVVPPAAQVQVTINIPTTSAPGTYFITALGGLLTGGVTDPTSASSVALIVPIPGTTVGLQASPNPLVLDYQGERSRLVIAAMTGTGTVSAPPEQLSFISSNAAIASVGVSGVVTAQTPGQAQISITFNNLSTVVNVQVLGGLRGDLNGDGQVDIDDINIIDLYLNTPATSPNDARDLNHDGLVNALDARILTTLCNYERCATHQ